MTELDMEMPDCPLCGSPERKHLYASRDGGAFGVCGCRQCDFAYLAPRVVEKQMLSLYERDDYFGRSDGEGYTDYSKQEDALRRTFRRLVAHLVKEGFTGEALLEIGCGFGYLLDEARPAERLSAQYVLALRHDRASGVDQNEPAKADAR